MTPAATCPLPLRERVADGPQGRRPGEGKAIVLRPHTRHARLRRSCHPLPQEGRAKPRAALVALLFVFPLLTGSASPDPDLPASADRAFAEGVALRGDSAAARPRFRAAAAGYDALWRQGHRTPAVAVARGRAHRLAGDLPQAVAALAAGHAAARYDRSVQQELEDARSAVVYPFEGNLAAACRPAPASGIASRMSPAEAWLIAGGLWLGACLATARAAMTRSPAWVVAAGVALIGLVTLGGFWWDDARRLDARPVLVLAVDAPLRTGNGDSYPAREGFERPLPKGVEARELLRRGGWVQVELAGGAVGWLPERSVLPAE